VIKIWNCRRSSIAVICILVLGILGYFKGMDVATAISTIAIGIGAANAYEKKGQTNDE
jgi:hypothetical protein